MPTTVIDEFEIEYEGVHLPAQSGWGAYLTIHGPSKNPMHLATIFQRQHVSVETVFLTQQAAEAEAHKVALALVATHQRHV